MSLNAFFLNIEGDKHFGRWLTELERRNQNPATKLDVICLMEVHEVNMPRIKDELQMEGWFFPMLNITEVNKHGLAPLGMWGVAFFTNLAHTSVQGDYYFQTADVKDFHHPDDAARVFVSSTVTKDGIAYTIGTTHFTWSPNGKDAPEQWRDLGNFLAIVERFPHIIFGGDFNAPRGGVIFGEIARGYTDHLPPEVTTTIDPALHYSARLGKPLELAVDTIFSTEHYQPVRVEVISGLSDHMAVAAQIERT